MRISHLELAASMILSAAAQAPSSAVIVNLDSAAWVQEKKAEPGSEAVMLRVDKSTGGIDLLVRFPAGHVIPAHFHDSNERIFVAEGELKLQRESENVVIKSGGFAWLPAHEVQRISCGPITRCTFYLSWDGKPDSHPAAVNRSEPRRGSHEEAAGK